MKCTWNLKQLFFYHLRFLCLQSFKLSLGWFCYGHTGIINNKWYWSYAFSWRALNFFFSCKFQIFVKSMIMIQIPIHFTSFWSHSCSLAMTLMKCYHMVKMSIKKACHGVGAAEFTKNYITPVTSEIGETVRAKCDVPHEYKEYFFSGAADVTMQCWLLVLVFSFGIFVNWTFTCK